MNRFRVSGVLACVLGLCVGVVQAEVPKGQDLIEKAVVAAGGAKKEEAYKSLRFTADVSAPAQGLNGTMNAVMRDKDVRIVVEFAGLGKIERGIIGGVAYEASDLMGARLVTGDEKEQMTSGLDPSEQNQKMKELTDLTVAGPEAVGGSDAWVITGKAKDGGVEKYWIDAKTFLPSRVQRTVKTQMGNIDVAIDLLNYKEFDGVPMATLMKQSASGLVMEIKVKDVQIDPDVSAEKFELPPAVKQLAEKQATTQPAK